VDAIVQDPDAVMLAKPRLSVKVRAPCGVRANRLARLAAKFRPEITLRDLLEQFSYDCLWRAEARGKRGQKRLRRLSARP
jgi:hypothetical protein